MNKFRELAGSGERAYTKGLRLLLGLPEVHPIVLNAIAHITPGLALRAPLTVRREEMIDGAIPDIVLEAADTFVILESKLSATLTARQKSQYLPLVQSDPRATRALIFVAPEGEITFYEGEIAELVNCGTLREAQARLRSKGVVLHLLTWGELTDELARHLPDLPLIAAEDVRQFIEFVETGAAGTKLDDGDDEQQEPIPVSEANRAALASANSSQLFEITETVIELLDEIAKDLSDEWPIRRKRKGDVVQVEILGKRGKVLHTLHTGVDVEFWKRFGQGPIWITWGGEDVVSEIEHRTTLAVLRERGFTAESIDQTEWYTDEAREFAKEEGGGYYIVGVAVPIPVTTDLWKETDAVRDRFEALLKILSP